MPRLHLRAFLFVAAASLATSACDRDSSTGPRPVTVCTDRPVITVSAGTNPEFSWSPNCLVTSVAVMQVGASTIQWTVRVPEPTIRSPWQYGEVPQGGTVFGSAPPLTPGVSYHVLLGLRTSETNERTVSSATFTP